MKIEIKEIYKCDYCRKLYQIKRFAIYHEEMCKKNPENKRACFGCKYLNKKDVIKYYDHPVIGEQQQTYHLCFCEKKELYVYPPQVEIKCNQIELADFYNEPMPKICEHFIDMYD